MRKLVLLVLAAAVLLVSACAGDTNNTSDYKQVVNHAKGRHPYLPKHDVEFNNYNAAQRLYDSPSTIIWCSTTWGNPSAPIVTVPIAGKLTSSSTTFFAPEGVSWGDSNDSGVLVPQRSVDGLYHPNPPQYRYGFTPGGQYVDFFNMPTICTTALTKFQRSATKMSLQVDPQVAQAQKQAEAALKSGDKKQAQHILEAATNGG